MTHDIPADLTKMRDLYFQWHPADHSGTDELIAFLNSLIYKAAMMSNEEGQTLIDQCIQDYMNQLKGRLGIPLEKPE